MTARSTPPDESLDDERVLDSVPATERPVRAGRARQREQARAKLLAAAKEVFEEKDFLAVRVSEIAERAGVSHGLFYHYFESKQEAFRELAASVGNDIIHSGDSPEVTATGTAWEQMEQAIRVYLQRYEHAGAMLVAIDSVGRFDPEVRELWAGIGREERSQIEASLRRNQRLGLMDRRLDPAMTALAVQAMTWRFAETWLVKREVAYSLDKAVEQLTRLTLNLLGADGAIVPPPPPRRRKT